MKKYRWDSDYDLDKHVFNMRFYNGDNKIIYSTYVYRSSEFKGHVQAVKSRLLSDNWKMVQRETEVLKQHREVSLCINGKTLKEAISIQEYTSDAHLRDLLEERKRIHSLK